MGGDKQSITIIVEGFFYRLLKSAKSSKQKIGKDTEDLKKTVNKLKL